MTNEELKNLKYPVGGFRFPSEASEEDIEEWKDIIAGFPEMLEDTVTHLADEELSFRYRPDGWSIRQVIHHLADSHMNSFIRFKLMLTEDDPIIKPYFEGQWAEMKDGGEAEITHSLDIIRGVHARWTVLLDTLDSSDYQRSLTHPEHGRKMSLFQNMALYSWHCNHHLAHINQALEHGGY